MKLAWSRTIDLDWRTCDVCTDVVRGAAGPPAPHAGLCAHHAEMASRQRHRIGPLVRLWQAKDVPESSILAALRMHPDVPFTTWPITSYSPRDLTQWRGGVRDQRITLASFPHLAPELAEFPEPVLRAKLASMRRRGLVSGCPCGCRGDWRLAPEKPCTPPRPSVATITAVDAERGIITYEYGDEEPLP